MRKLLIFFILSSLFFSVSYSSVFADSPYVLPYPGTMPGRITYKLHVLYEKLEKYWYFGNFGQFEYNLNESDKYLVEAKTLFDYKQYLLAENALQKSNQYFQQTLPFLLKAKAEGKDISDKRKILSQAAEKHIEELSRLKLYVPDFFVWSPEKAASSTLYIDHDLDNAIKMRQKDL